MSKPWIEKYRPRTLADIASQEEVVRALTEIVSNPQKAAALPHLLFHGPAGTGKTTSALALARHLFGHDIDLFRARVKEMNASDDRGIQVIRDKVKKFAQNAVGGGGAAQGVPSYKIIILDEADALLPDAQAALRRMMEDFATSTRFILICNYVSRIIDPITSRCVKYRFKPLPKEIVIRQLQGIATKENIVTPTTRPEDSANFFEQLYEVSSGDMRNAVTLLQSALQFSPGGIDSSDSLCDILNMVPPNALRTYIEGLTSGSYPRMQQVTMDLLRQGYSASRILHQILPCIVQGEASGGLPLTNVQRSILCLKLSEVEKRLNDGGDDTLQLLDFGASVLAL